MIIAVDDLSSRNYAVLHYKGRFVLFDVTTGKNVLDGSFTLKRVINYLVDELRIESDDVDGAHDLAAKVMEAIKNDHSLGYGSFDDCIKNNRYGESGAPLDHVQYVTRFFLKGKAAKEQIYMCDCCFEGVVITSSHPEWLKFADNGGDQPVSDYCDHCSWEKIMAY